MGVGESMSHLVCSRPCGIFVQERLQLPSAVLILPFELIGLGGQQLDQCVMGRLRAMRLATGYWWLKEFEFAIRAWKMASTLLAFSACGPFGSSLR